MKIELNWKKPLFYLVLPVLIIMVFLGFPLPLAPPPAIRVSQEQAVQVEPREAV